MVLVSPMYRPGALADVGGVARDLHALLAVVVGPRRDWASRAICNAVSSFIAVFLDCSLATRRAVLRKPQAAILIFSFQNTRAEAQVGYGGVRAAGDAAAPAAGACESGPVPAAARRCPPSPPARRGAARRRACDAAYSGPAASAQACSSRSRSCRRPQPRAVNSRLEDLAERARGLSPGRWRRMDIVGSLIGERPSVSQLYALATSG